MGKRSAPPRLAWSEETLAGGSSSSSSSTAAAASRLSKVMRAGQNKRRETDQPGGNPRGKYMLKYTSSLETRETGEGGERKSAADFWYLFRPGWMGFFYCLESTKENREAAGFVGSHRRPGSRAPAVSGGGGRRSGAPGFLYSWKGRKGGRGS